MKAVNMPPVVPGGESGHDLRFRFTGRSRPGGADLETGARPHPWSSRRNRAVRRDSAAWPAPRQAPRRRGTTLVTRPIRRRLRPPSTRRPVSRRMCGAACQLSRGSSQPHDVTADRPMRTTDELNVAEDAAPDVGGQRKGRAAAGRRAVDRAITGAQVRSFGTSAAIRCWRVHFRDGGETLGVPRTVVGGSVGPGGQKPRRAPGSPPPGRLVGGGVEAWCRS